MSHHEACLRGALCGFQLGMQLRVNEVLYRRVVRVQASYRFTHNRDIVPSWPPTWVGFHHLPREVWQVDFGDAGVRAPLSMSSNRMPCAHLPICQDCIVIRLMFLAHVLMSQESASTACATPDGCGLLLHSAPVSLLLPYGS